MKIITVGRAPGNDIRIIDPYLNPNHCQFIMDDSGNFYVMDLNSRNGTYVNGIKCTGKVMLNRNDTVRIGQTTLPWQDYFPYNSQPRPNPQPRPQPNPSPRPQPRPNPQPRPQPRPQPEPSYHDYHDSHDHHDSWSNNNKTDNTSIFILVLGLISIGFIAYIVFNFFTSAAYQWVKFLGGQSASIKLFPVYLHGYLGIGGQWFSIIAAIVLGVIADFIPPLDEDNRMVTIGKWLANAGVTIGGIFLLLAIFAEKIVTNL